MDAKVIDLLTSGQPEEALLLLADKKSNARLMLADYRNEKRLLEENIITPEEFNSYREAIIDRIINLPQEPGPTNKIPERTIFLSYNHSDRDTAYRIARKMAMHQVQVSMDKTDVLSGELITDFIARQTRQTNAVMLLLSKNSLQSAWVTYESTLAMFNEILANRRIRLVALDNAYEDDDFFETACDEFNRQIQDLEQKIASYKSKGLDSLLVEDKQRKYKNALKRLPDIFQKIRASAVFSIAGDNFDDSLDSIARDLLEQQ